VKIDSASPEHAYVQLAGLLRQRILSGEITAKLPLLTELTAQTHLAGPRFRWRSRFWSFLLKLDPARPSPTIQAQPGPNVGPFHWENRRLRLPARDRQVGGLWSAGAVSGRVSGLTLGWRGWEAADSW
jgi:hypothetical protein